MQAQAHVHLMAGQPQGQQFHITGFSLGITKAGISSLCLPTGIGGGGGGLAAIAAASTLSHSATLWARVGSWRIRSSQGCQSPSERFFLHQKVCFACWGRAGPWIRGTGQGCSYKRGLLQNFDCLILSLAGCERMGLGSYSQNCQEQKGR